MGDEQLLDPLASGFPWAQRNTSLPPLRGETVTGGDAFACLKRDWSEMSSSRWTAHASLSQCGQSQCEFIPGFGRLHQIAIHMPSGRRLVVLRRKPSVHRSLGCEEKIRAGARAGKTAWFLGRVS